jgi:hypothetical protein
MTSAAADLNSKNATISNQRSDPYSANSDCDTAAATSYCTYEFPIRLCFFRLIPLPLSTTTRKRKRILLLVCVSRTFNLQPARNIQPHHKSNPAAGSIITMMRTGRTTYLFWSTIWLLWPLLFTTTTTLHAFTSPLIAGRWSNNRGGEPDNDNNHNSATRLTMANKNPTTFREAEVLGLKLMQEQKYAEALVGMCVVR